MSTDVITMLAKEAANPYTAAATPNPMGPPQAPKANPYAAAPHPPGAALMPKPPMPQQQPVAPQAPAAPQRDAFAELTAPQPHDSPQNVTQFSYNDINTAGKQWPGGTPPPAIQRQWYAQEPQYRSGFSGNDMPWNPSLTSRAEEWAGGQLTSDAWKAQHPFGQNVVNTATNPQNLLAATDLGLMGLKGLNNVMRYNPLTGRWPSFTPPTNAINSLGTGSFGRVAFNPLLALDYDPTHDGSHTNAMMLAPNLISQGLNLARGAPMVGSGAQWGARASAPLYLGIDAAKEGYQGYNRGIADNPDLAWNDQYGTMANLGNSAAAVGLGFNARTNDTLNLNENTEQFTGQHLRQIGDNMGHPMQMLWAGPKSLYNLGDSLYANARQAGESKVQDATSTQMLDNSYANRMQNTPSAFEQRYRMRLVDDQNSEHYNTGASNTGLAARPTKMVWEDTQTGQTMDDSKLPEWAHVANNYKETRPYLYADMSPEELNWALDNFDKVQATVPPHNPAALHEQFLQANPREREQEIARKQPGYVQLP